MHFKRKLRQFWAFLMRTFVFDCPVCNKHCYGNQQFGVNLHHETKKTTFRIVCHRCVKLLK